MHLTLFVISGFNQHRTTGMGKGRTSLQQVLGGRYWVSVGGGRRRICQVHTRGGSPMGRDVFARCFVVFALDL